MYSNSEVGLGLLDFSIGLSRDCSSCLSLEVCIRNFVCVCDGDGVARCSLAVPLFLPGTSCSAKEGIRKQLSCIYGHWSRSCTACSTCKPFLIMHFPHLMPRRHPTSLLQSKKQLWEYDVERFRK